MIVEKVAAAKLKELAKTPAAKPAEPPPLNLGLPGDRFNGEAVPIKTEGETLHAAVEAAKAAESVPGGQPPPASRPAGPPPEAPSRPVASGRPFGSTAISGFVRGLAGNHPVAAIARGAVRLVPIAGFLVATADMKDLEATLRDPKAPRSQKILAGVKALAGVATIGAAGLLVGTGAAAFLPYLLAAGGVAVVADVALSRLRRGHW